MAMLTSGLFCLSALLALRSGLQALVRNDRTLLDWVWGIFCVSICFAMLKHGFGAALGPYQYLLGIGAAATCNMFWLVSRALFRPSPAIEAPAWAFALVISALIVVRCLGLFVIALWWGDAHQALPWLNAIDALLGLFGSGVMVLTVYEMLRDYPLATPDEQQVRRGLIAVFSICVLLSSVVPELWSDPQQRSAVKDIMIGLSAGCIVLIAGRAVRWRRQIAQHDAPAMPVASDNPKSVKVSAELNDELMALSKRIEQVMGDTKLFLDPELKVAHLADALHVPDYKITRALTGCLAQKNFNQYVNRFRIAHAQAMLRDSNLARLQILQVALRSGFASLGPFNRAFKAQCNMAPNEYRSRYLLGQTVPKPHAELRQAESS
jgi:AraC-like DNA-binding protein